MFKMEVFYKIGKNCIIGAKALITENKEIPDNSLGSWISRKDS